MDADLTDLQYEILDAVYQSDETTRMILHDIRNPVNADEFSDEAKDLDFDGLDAVFRELEQRGLVTRSEDLTDGFEHPRPGVTYTWWKITAAGVRACDAREATENT